MVDLHMQLSAPKAIRPIASPIGSLAMCFETLTGLSIVALREVPDDARSDKVGHTDREFLPRVDEEFKPWIGWI